MWYEINVSKFGKHFFHTAENDLTTWEEARRVFMAIVHSFPSNQGYSVTVTRQTITGKDVTSDMITGENNE